MCAEWLRREHGDSGKCREAMVCARWLRQAQIGRGEGTVPGARAGCLGRGQGAWGEGRVAEVSYIQGTLRTMGVREAWIIKESTG